MLSSTQLSQVGNFDQNTINGLGRALGTREAISAAGALSLNCYESSLTISGTMAFTLAAPTVAGQKKKITCVAASNTPIGTLTVSSPDTTTGFVCASTFVFTVAGQSIELEATTGLKWRCVRKQRSGVLTVEIGVTVLTGYSMSLVYALQVDGTDTSTGTKGLPDGSTVGERCTLTCALANNTPVGSIDGTFKGMLGDAYTHVGAIGVLASTTAVGDCAVLEWDGAAWQVMYQNGCTLS